MLGSAAFSGAHISGAGGSAPRLQGAYKNDEHGSIHSGSTKCAQRKQQRRL